MNVYVIYLYCTSRHRMNGKIALWVPGTDHAGIATQTVVEKKIMKQEGKTRHDYGRDAFVKKVPMESSVHKNSVTMCNIYYIYVYVISAGLGVEGAVRQPHLPPAEAHGLLRRLD
jgi:hypothetical protein